MCCKEINNTICAFRGTLIEAQVPVTARSFPFTSTIELPFVCYHWRVVFIPFNYHEIRLKSSTCTPSTAVSRYTFIEDTSSDVYRRYSE